MLKPVGGLVGQELIREIDGKGASKTFEAFNHHFAVHCGDDRHDLFSLLGIQHGPFLLLPPRPRLLKTPPPDSVFSRMILTRPILGDERPSDKNIKHRSPTRKIGWSDDKL